MNSILIGFAVLLQTSIYNINITKSEGEIVSLSAYQGKKIMLVNIATGSERIGQLTQLQQLQQQYGDSLVIIVFPSNSFGKETRSNLEIKQFCENTYNTSFVIAAKNPVAGTGLQPVYQWLASSAQNEAMDIAIGGDFQKILIDKDGAIIGVFAPVVSPTHASVISAITGN